MLETGREEGVENQQEGERDPGRGTETRGKGQRSREGTQRSREQGQRLREMGVGEGEQRSRKTWDRELERRKIIGCLGTMVEMTDPRLDREQQNTKQAALAPVLSFDRFMRTEDELRWWYCFLRRSVNQSKDAQGRACDLCLGLVLLPAESLEAAGRSWH